jgi:hypothetical protein
MLHATGSECAVHLHRSSAVTLEKAIGIPLKSSQVWACFIDVPFPTAGDEHHGSLSTVCPSV